jgi:uncharacterized protein (UPF0218 family)
VENPAGTITEDLEKALTYAIGHTPITIMVDGEEDLAVIPLVIAAPESSVILYGQPNKGIVLRTIDDKAKAAAKELLRHFVRVGEQK